MSDDLHRSAIAAVITELAEVYDKRLSASTIASYIQDLEPYALGDINAVQLELRRTSSHWPRPADWVRLLDQRLTSARASLPPTTNIDSYWCPKCEDTGFVIWQRPCPGSGPKITCPYKADHASHTERMASPCTCRIINPVYQRRRGHALADASGDDRE